MDSLNFDFSDETFRPLAERMRPRTLQAFYGQQHLLAQGQPLFNAIEKGHIHSMIFWGTAGCGKTTLVEIIARRIQARVERLSAVISGIKDIREAIENAKKNRQLGIKTLLFVDEVHRFNKAQQDAFLPHIEDGTIIFIGATTENPSFELNNALLSRAKVCVLKPLQKADILQVLKRAITDKEQGLGRETFVIQDNVLDSLAEFVNGDARSSLNYLELMAENATESDQGKVLDLPLLKMVLGERQGRFDKNGDRFYAFLSALHKSIRGSSPDGALYWYVRMISAGCDPLVVARRLLAIASEDIGNADPRAMQIAINAWDCFTRVGAYEGERAIAQAVIYLALAPKSNAVYVAFNQAKKFVQETPDYDVPLHLRPACSNLMKDLGFGEEYRYAHDEENAYSAGENYFPEEMKHQRFYFPVERGLEIQLKEKMTRLEALDKASPHKRYKD